MGLQRTPALSVYISICLAKKKEKRKGKEKASSRMWFYVSEPYYVSQALGKEESQKPKLHMDTIFILSRQFLDPLFGCRKPEGRLVLEEL